MALLGLYFLTIEKLMHRNSSLENKFQRELIKELKRVFLGCFVLKNDASYIQGIPDLTIFYGPHYAILECKAARPTSSDDYEPNQEHYLEKFKQMSYSATIYPENRLAIFEELRQFFDAPPFDERA